MAAGPVSGPVPPSLKAAPEAAAAEDAAAEAAGAAAAEAAGVAVLLPQPARSPAVMAQARQRAKNFFFILVSPSRFVFSVPFVSGGRPDGQRGDD
jgi:hypothetical protein